MYWLHQPNPSERSLARSITEINAGGIIEASKN